VFVISVYTLRCLFVSVFVCFSFYIIFFLVSYCVLIYSSRRGSVRRILRHAVISFCLRFLLFFLSVCSYSLRGHIFCLVLQCIVDFVVLASVSVDTPARARSSSQRESTPNLRHMCLLNDGVRLSNCFNRLEPTNSTRPELISTGSLHHKRRGAGHHQRPACSIAPSRVKLHSFAYLHHTTVLCSRCVSSIHMFFSQIPRSSFFRPFH